MDNVKQLPVEIKTIWRIRALIDLLVWLLIAVPFLVWALLAPDSWQPWLWSITWVIAAFGVIESLVELALVPYHYRFWTYYINDRQVELHHGFFFRKQIVIPIARVQNVTLIQGPVIRLKHLQKVKVMTAAGGEDIAGLKEQEANDLKELIMKLAKEARNDI
ncbi:PH domain-containing protein [Companilactobacillus zhongbaensis]|uniref:PH domain-containing protein n=1 Tax=Companilactobacillus zhongbaensis TaxID=2486009 RepID=UPI000F7783B1|nr:PH domain-containing protein [Companilactobacillus zhongbaensis]